MTPPEAIDFPFDVDPDFNIWVPALHPVELESRDPSIVRLYTMEDPTRVLKAADDIHALAMTLRIRRE